MSKRYTYRQIAEDFELWAEYVDPNAAISEQEFNEMTTYEKVEIQLEMFKPQAKAWIEQHETVFSFAEFTKEQILKAVEIEFGELR